MPRRTRASSPKTGRPRLTGLIAHINAVVSAAPRLPFYCYHSMMSGVDLPMAKFLEAADG